METYAPVMGMILVSTSQDGLSDRKIAAALKVVRTTVRRYLETWPEPRFSPSRRFLDVVYRCNNGFLQRMSYTTMPYKAVIRLLVVARNPTNGFPARLLAGTYLSN